MITRRLTDAIRGWWPARIRRLHSGEHNLIMAAARREQHGGLAALYLTGTAYEMGYQHGTLAQDLIRGFRRDAYAYVLSQVPGPAWTALPLLFQHTSAYWPTIPAEFTQEMRGIADSAGVHPIETLVSTAIWEVFHTHGCSQFVAANRATTGGSLFHGYNYDLMDPDHALIQPYLAAIFYRPDRGIPFVTLNTAGSVGVNGGMNEVGISVAWDNTYLRDSALTAGLAVRVVPFIITLRRLLQYASSLDEAVGIVTGSLPRPLGDIVIIASAREGKAVALETAGRAFAIRHMDGDAVWSTNCFQSEELSPHDSRGDGHALPLPERWRRFPRYSAYEALFATQQGTMTADKAAALLRDPYPREKEGYQHPLRLPRTTICRDITSWSLLMEPGPGRFWSSDTKIPGCQGSFYAFDVRNWLRLPVMDIPPTGYHAALCSAQHFLAGDRAESLAALDEARRLDGASAPLQLMKALLLGLEGAQSQANRVLQEAQTRWSETPAGALAHAWLIGSSSSSLQSIPFPSAIRPLIHLTVAKDWARRAIPVGS